MGRLGAGPGTGNNQVADKLKVKAEKLRVIFPGLKPLQAFIGRQSYRLTGTQEKLDPVKKILIIAAVALE